ncbi:MAG TPA: alpha/beta fold hydrolase [Anaerolineae bacterium]|nr:alpha/beta fold hydrolase [Anaerolineae bacterium]
MTLRKPVWIIVILALLLSACNTTPAPAPTASATATVTPQPTGVPQYEKTDCWFKPPIGRDVECGWLIVPEDHAKPDGNTIKLAVARFKSDASQPEADPIVYLEGGPGGSPLKSYPAQFDIVFGPLAAKRDVILFDQRGTGYSQPSFTCPELKQEALDTLDENLSPEQSADLSTKAAAQCHDRLAKDGANFALYNSAQNAADVEALRQALGYDKINLYGISYGTRLALETLRDFPQGIRSVVIDGILPPQADLYAQTPVNGEHAIEALFNTCEADPACQQNYPDLRQVLADLKTKFDKDPVKFEVTLHSGGKKEALLNGDGLINTLFQGLYITSLIPALPRMIYDARDGNYDMLSGLTALTLSQLDDISYGMYFSVQCQEEIPFTNAAELDAFVKQNPEFAALADRSSLQVCKVWNVPAAPAAENQAVSSEVPTLVFSGEFDPITPPAYGKQAAETLSKSYFFQLPKAGHGASASEDCPRSMAIAFFDNPTQKPDDACLSEMAQTPFVAPVKASDFKLTPFSEAQLGLSGVVPENWVKVQPGIYTPSGKTTDQTGIVFQAAPIAPEMFLNLLTQQISQANIQINFEKAGTRTANGIDWTLYTTQADISSIDLALGQKDNVTYLVMMQSPLNDRKALVDGVFLPAIDALQPTK